MNNTNTIIPVPIPIPVGRTEEKIKPFNWDYNWVGFWPWFFIGAFILTIIIGILITFIMLKNEGYDKWEFIWLILVSALAFGLIGLIAFILPLLFADINRINTSINANWLIEMRKIIVQDGNKMKSWDDIFKSMKSYPIEIKTIIKNVQNVLNTGLSII